MFMKLKCEAINVVKISQQRSSSEQFWNYG